MKKFLSLICALTLATSVSAQVVSYGTKDGAYEEIVNCNSNKSQLWSNLKRWVSVTFVSYKHTVDMEDAESGSMIIKYSVTEENIGSYTASKTTAVLQVDVKDNKYRVKICDPIFEVFPNNVGSGDISWMPTTMLKAAKVEMEAALKLSQSGIKSYKDLKTTIAAYTSLRDGTPKYRKPKDEKKGKIDEAYQVYDKAARLAEWLQTMYRYRQDKIVESLKNGMAYSNDF